VTPSTTPTIRLARLADAEVIADFNRFLAHETESITLDPPTVLAGVRALLADPMKGRYFVAEAGGEVIGQVMHTYEWSDWRNATFWWLQSVYVRADWRGRGVFKSLFRHVTGLATSTPGICGVRLYVEEHNHRAREVYRRLGLNPAGYLVLGSKD
jgi:GNAT superfamily N-acetyltransferase